MYAVIDVETTGGSPHTDRIIEIAVFVFDGTKVTDSFSTLVNPLKPIDSYVTKLTGITDAMVQSAPTFSDIHEKILDLTHENIFVAHNVKFDFGMIRQEFRRLGIDFNRKQLDTVNLARKVLPGFDSYSLGNICDSIGIAIENRHRAAGDAEATVKLLEYILTKSASARQIEIELNHGIDADLLPPFISKAEIEKLPEDAGVFYFRDEVGRVLYLDGVKNIRKKVINYFSGPADSPEKKRLFDLIRSIDYELTGNELCAKLLGYREIKSNHPEFNKRPRQYNFAYGIFFDRDEHGFIQLKIHPLNWNEGELAMKFTTRPGANKVLGKIIKENNLHAWFALRTKMRETGADEAGIKKHNSSIEKAVRKYIYRQPNFFIITEGIHPESNAVVWVEQNTYRGFGYFTTELTTPTPDNLKEVIKSDEDDYETQKIIRSYLRKMKGIKVIPY